MNHIKLLVVLLLVVGCKKSALPINQENVENDKAQTTSIIATKATYYDSLFTRYGDGWTGGDGAISYRLPDGRDIWLFGDSYLGTVRENRTRKPQGFINNTLVITTQSPYQLSTLYKGTKLFPEAYIQPINDDLFYWPASCVASPDQTKLYVFMLRVKSTGTGGAFGFEIMGTDIATLSLPDLTVTDINRFYIGGKINWSSCILEDGNFFYIYGAEKGAINKYMHIARVNKINPLTTLRYWNGSNWVKDSTQSSRVKANVSDNYTVFKQSNTYYLLSQETLLGPHIYLYDGPSPTGPFDNKRLVYETPLVTANSFTYNAYAHTQFMEDGKLLIGYSNNTFEGNEHYTNVDTYRPNFIWIENWQ